MTIQEAVELYNDITGRIKQIHDIKKEVLESYSTNPLGRNLYYINDNNANILFECLDEYVWLLRTKLQEEFNRGDRDA